MYIIIRFNHNVGIIDHHCVNILKKNKQTKHKQTITKKKTQKNPQNFHNFNIYVTKFLPIKSLPITCLFSPLTENK